MQVHQPDIDHDALTALPHIIGAQRISRPLATVACIYAATVIVLCAAARGLGPAAWQPGLVVLRQTGAVGAALAAIILAFGATLSCIAMTGIRRRALAGLSRPRSRSAFGRSRFRRLFDRAESLPKQAFPLFAAAGASVAAMAVLHAQAAVASPATATWFVLAGVGILAAFPLLVAERILDAIPPAQLPELPRLKPFVVLPLACLALISAAEVAAGLGVALARLTVTLIDTVLLVVAIELTLRAALTRAQPAPDLLATRSPVDSLLLRFLGRAISRPTSWSEMIRERFGIDFARSWALRYVRRAAAPVIAALVAFSIFLTGVVRIDTNERGVYQRLGRPVAVLRPGLHLILPWPLGQIRRTEFGVLHAEPISYDDGQARIDPLLAALGAGQETPTIEGPAPASANRLWDSDQPSDVSYIISSDSRGQQSFETISVSMRVLWQIGLDDASARRAVYAVIDHDTVVRTMASQVLARYLASRTLPQVLGEDQASITHSLETGLQQMLDAIGSGIQVVSVIIEAIHPPGGAAQAYRSVQAAEIGASTAISEEQGRAETTLGLARRDAADAISAATAATAERVAAARIVRTNLQADVAAYRTGPAPFALERYLAQLVATLPLASVEVVDHRLDEQDAPTLDLRPFDRTGDMPVPRGNRMTGTGENPQ